MLSCTCCVRSQMPVVVVVVSVLVLTASEGSDVPSALIADTR